MPESEEDMASRNTGNHLCGSRDEQTASATAALTPEGFIAAVAEIERDLNWTEEDASNCGCNYREEPCDRCWSLGWRIGGIALSRKDQA